MKLDSDSSSSEETGKNVERHADPAKDIKEGVKHSTLSNQDTIAKKATLAWPKSESLSSFSSSYSTEDEKKIKVGVFAGDRTPVPSANLVPAAAIPLTLDPASKEVLEVPSKTLPKMKGTALPASTTVLPTEKPDSSPALVPSVNTVSGGVVPLIIPAPLPSDTVNQRKSVKVNKGIKEDDSSDSDDDEESKWMRYLFPRMDPRFGDPGIQLEEDEEPPNFAEQKIGQFLFAPFYEEVYFFIMFTSLLWLIIAIPISQIDLNDKACYTYWGYKKDCASPVYTYPAALIECKHTQNALIVGSSFAIITVCTLFVLILLMGYQMFFLGSPSEAQKWAKNLLRELILGFSVAACVCHLISWACITVVFLSDWCSAVPTGKTYGPGFGINITFWVLNILGAITYTLRLKPPINIL